MILKTNFNGSHHLGIFCVVNDNIAVVPLNSSKKFINQLKQNLEVDTVKTNMSNTSLIGIFSAANNKKIIVPNILEKEELNTLKDFFPEVLVLNEKYTALGNLIAMNDHGIACSKYLKPILEAVNLKIADSDLIGASLFVNNSGFLAHRDATKEELEKIEKIFNVKGGTSTLNFGDPFIKSGIIGNKKGIMIGGLTSGPELRKVDEIFGKY